MNGAIALSTWIVFLGTSIGFTNWRPKSWSPRKTHIFGSRLQTMRSDLRARGTTFPRLKVFRRFSTNWAGPNYAIVPNDSFLVFSPGVSKGRVGSGGSKPQ